MNPCEGQVILNDSKRNKLKGFLAVSLKTYLFMNAAVVHGLKLTALSLNSK